MKIILLILLLISTPVMAQEQHARMSLPIVGGGAFGCSRTVLLSENWETDYTDGEEWSAHNWTEQDATTNVHVADNAQKYAGTYSGMTVGQTGNASRKIYRTFTQQTSGKITTEFWYRVDDTSYYGAFLGIGNDVGTVVGCNVQAWTTSLQTYNGAGWQTLGTISADTWYKIEIVMDIDNYNNSNACTYYIDGGSALGPYAGYTATANSPDTLFVDCWNTASGQFTWFDNLTVYDGDRCN